MEKVVTGTRAVSDKIGSQIYGAVDTIVTVSEPTRNHYEQYRKLLAENRQQERELAAQHRAEAQEPLDVQEDEAKTNGFDDSQQEPENR